MSERNKHGLSRHVDEAVRRQLRQEAGFGCLKCGYIRGDCEHIDPTFPDATVHDPSKMAFLCTRCHREVTDRPGLKQWVWEWKRNPYARRRRETTPFEIETAAAGCVIRLGVLEFRDCSALLSVDGEVLLSVAPPGPGESMLRVSGRFFDESGRLVLVIENSVVQLNVDNWDVAVKGEHLRIWSAHRRPVLDLGLGPPTVQVHLVRALYNGVQVRVSPKLVRIGANELRLAAADNVFVGCLSCISGTRDKIILGDADPDRGHASLTKADLSFDGCTFRGGILATGSGEIKMHGCVFHGRRSPEASRKQLVPNWGDVLTVIGGDMTVRLRRSTVQGLWASASWPGVSERYPSQFGLARSVLMNGHAFSSELPQLVAELRAIATEIARLRNELPALVDLAARSRSDEYMTLRATLLSLQFSIHDADVAALIAAAEGASRSGKELTLT